MTITAQEPWIGTVANQLVDLFIPLDGNDTEGSGAHLSDGPVDAEPPSRTSRQFYPSTAKFILPREGWGVTAIAEAMPRQGG